VIQGLKGRVGYPTLTCLNEKAFSFYYGVGGKERFSGKGDKRKARRGKKIRKERALVIRRQGSKFRRGIRGTMRVVCHIKS